MTTQAPGHMLEIGSEAFLADPVPRLAELRHSGGVCPVDHGRPAHGSVQDAETPWLAVTRADLARIVMLDTTTYSSSLSKHVAPPAEVADAVAAIRARGWPYTAALGASDAPLHGKHRKLVNKAFTPRGLRAMEPTVREVAEQLARELPDSVEIDFLAVFAGQLPVLAISRVLGLPDERYADIRRWSTAAVATIGASPSAADWLRYETDLLDFQHTVADLLQRGRTEKIPGLIGILAATADAADAAGDPWDLPLLLTLMRELVVAGNETTGKYLAEAIRLMGAQSETWARLRQDPSLSERLVEESLRLASPTQSVMRRATVDTELGAMPVPAGTLVMVSLASANRDEAVHAEPDAFEPERDGVRSHLAFGIGPHSCIGAGLARMESRIALEVLAGHVDRIVPSQRPPVYNRSYTIRGPIEMYATVHRLAQPVEES